MQKEGSDNKFWHNLTGNGLLSKEKNLKAPHSESLFTLLTADILSGKNVRTWVSIDFT